MYTNHVCVCTTAGRSTCHPEIEFPIKPAVGPTFVGLLAQWVPSRMGALVYRVLSNILWESFGYDRMDIISPVAADEEEDDDAAVNQNATTW